MMDMRVWIFNVDRGLCVLVRTSSGHGVMIDCGCSSDWSPSRWIASQKGPVLTPWSSSSSTYDLAWLVVTHPHDDHVEDIANVKQYLTPGVLSRHKDYDWDAILKPQEGEPSENTKEYYEWQKTYSRTVPKEELPQLGCTFKRFSLDPAEAAELSSDSQHILNNSSYISVFTWTLIDRYWKLMVCGDNETNGLRTLLSQQEFIDEIAGTHFFVTPHHGHDSGYSPELFEAMGKPLCNITSERKGDQSVANEYTAQAQGCDFKGDERQHLTTRTDGHIVLQLTPSGYNFL